MKNSLSSLILVLFAFALCFSACNKSESVTDPSVENRESFHEMENQNILSLEDNNIIFPHDSEIAKMIKEYRNLTSNNAELLSNDCDDEDCQSCNGVGSYSQITTGQTGGINQLVFQAHTFLQGANPMCPCYTDIAGTLTYEYEISEHPSGQPITQGSVTQPINSQSPGYCGFGYPGGPILQNEFRYPHPGGSIFVELTTIHTLGSQPYQIFTHDTWGVY